MKLALLASLFAAGAYGASKIPNPKPTYVDYLPTGKYNCDCNCDCQVSADCHVDYLVLLDAASCVRDAWNEMKNRVRQLAQEIDDSGKKLGSNKSNGMKSASRFSVLRYAEKAEVAISFEENMNFVEFSSALRTVKTWNSASKLKAGWDLLNAQVDKWEQSFRGAVTRKLVVIVVTNGISHPGQGSSPTRSEIYALDRKVYNLNQQNIGLFINTIIKPVENDFERSDQDCDACKWNSELFIKPEECNNFDYTQCTPYNLKQRALDKKNDVEISFDKNDCCSQYAEHGLSRGITKEQIYYKSAIMQDDRLQRNQDPLLDKIKAICGENPDEVNKNEEICNNCVCDCQIPVPPNGPPGPPGLPGPDGPDGKPGQDGEDGEDGAHGIPGPDGGNGCDGACGNPGQHGKPGQPGRDGQPGAPGKVGCQGKQGAKATPHKYADGPAGPKGPSGPAGDNGNDGRPGQPGRSGAPGVQGAEGKPGKVGENGRPGKQGNNGRPGGNGQPGEQGPPGANGNPGATGAKGPQGPRGDRGAPGVCGRQGQNGAPGNCGRPGPKGVPGMQGPCGQPGQMGAGVSEYEIRAKVSAVLDKLLPKLGSHNTFCQCKNYQLFNFVVERFNF